MGLPVGIYRVRTSSEGARHNLSHFSYDFVAALQFQVSLQFFNKIRWFDADNHANIQETGDADPVSALFVFLNLLKAYIQLFCHIALA